MPAELLARVCQLAIQTTWDLVPPVPFEPSLLSIVPRSGYAYGGIEEIGCARTKYAIIQVSRFWRGSCARVCWSGIYITSRTAEGSLRRLRRAIDILTQSGYGSFVKRLVIDTTVLPVECIRELLALCPTVQLVVLLGTTVWSNEELSTLALPSSVRRLEYLQYFQYDSQDLPPPGVQSLSKLLNRLPNAVALRTDFASYQLRSSPVTFLHIQSLHISRPGNEPQFPLIFSHTSFPALTHLTVHACDNNAPYLSFLDAVGGQILRLSVYPISHHGVISIFNGMLPKCKILEEFDFHHTSWSPCSPPHPYSPITPHPTLKAIHLHTAFDGSTVPLLSAITNQSWPKLERIRLIHLASIWKHPRCSLSLPHQLAAQFNNLNVSLEDWAGRSLFDGRWLAGDNSIKSTAEEIIYQRVIRDAPLGIEAHATPEPITTHIQQSSGFNSAGLFWKDRWYV